MPCELFDVRGRVAVVTGATGVLGSAMAEGLAREGMRLAVLGRNSEKGSAVVDRIRAGGGEAEFYQVDVTSRESCETAAGLILARFDRIDVLVNSAGGNRPDATATDDLSFFDLSDEGLQQVMNLNALGTVIPCQVFGAAIAAQRSGSIVNISSMAAMTPLTRVVGYSAAKAAVSNFTQWLSVYLCQKIGPELRVNAIAPGFFLTDQNRFLLTTESGTLTDRGEQIVQHTPMGRFGDPDDLIGTLLWLVSPASRFVTGIVLPVDGGFSAFSGV